jgi:transcription initiation factor TFIIB
MTQPTRSTLDFCPACDGPDIDESLENFNGVCEECGFVIRADEGSVSLDWKLEEPESGDDDQNDWLEECPIRNATEKRLAEAFDALETCADHLGISDELRQETADIYCDAFRAETTDGRAATCLIVACLRMASLRCQTPVPLGRLYNYRNIGRTALRRSLTALKEDLSLQVDTPRPAGYLSFIGTTSTVSDAQLSRTERLLDDVENEPSLVGKDPAGIAAAGIYLCGDLTQAEAADAVGVSTETIRLRVNQLQELTDHD